MCIAATSGTGKEVFGLPGTAGVIDISYIMHSFNYDKSSVISQLLNGESRDLQKLLKYFNGTTTSASNIFLSSGVLPITFVLYSKDLLVIVFFFYAVIAVLFLLSESFTSTL